MKKILKNLAAAAMLGLVFCTGVTSHASNGNVVLVLDPGHDVHDAGARRTWNGVTYAEETITLKMAQYCKEELEKFWDEYKRLINPHIYKVDLSDGLYEMKQKMLLGNLT